MSTASLAFVFTIFTDCLSCGVLYRLTLLECLLTCSFLAVYYCNSMLYGARAHVTCKLQAVLNAAARLTTGVGRYDHITPILRDILHWLPVNQHIIYKIALLAYKCLHGIGSAYLKNYCITLITKDLHHPLCSVAGGDIAHPATRTRRFGLRRFGFSYPTIWNFLPLFVWNAQSLAQFKKQLKQHLFRTSYD